MDLLPTPRQIYYLQMLADGRSQSQAAYFSRRNIGTVKKMLGEARRRLGAKTIEQALVIATTMGLIEVLDIPGTPINPQLIHRDIRIYQSKKRNRRKSH